VTPTLASEPRYRQALFRPHRRRLSSPYTWRVACAASVASLSNLPGREVYSKPIGKHIFGSESGYPLTPLSPHHDWYLVHGGSIRRAVVTM